MHPLIENYLQQVKSQIESLPSEKQDEEIEEIRQHLQAMVRENQKTGATEDEAVATALQQFGNPKGYATALRKGLGERRNTPIQNAFLGMVLGVSLLLLLGYGRAGVGLGSPLERVIEAALGGGVGGLLGSRFMVGNALKVSRTSLLFQSLEIGLRVAAVGWVCGAVGGAIFGATNVSLALTDPHSTVSTLQEMLRYFLVLTLGTAIFAGFGIGTLAGIWGFTLGVVNHVRKTHKTQTQ